MRRIIITSLCLALFFTAYLCLPYSSASAVEHPLKVAITPVLVERNVDMNKRLIEYIGRKAGVPVDIVQRKTYQEVFDLIEQRQVDIAFVCTVPYIIGKEKFGMGLLAVPKADGKPLYYSYVIVPKDSPAKSIEDLKGKLYAYSDQLSNSGYLYPRYRLAKAGYSPKHFFRKWVLTYSHTASIEAVSSGLVDGASVDSYIYNLISFMHPELTSKTRIIEVSPPFGFTPVVVRANFPPKLKSRIRSALVDMEKDPEGKKILRELHLDGFVAGNDTLFDSVRVMYRFMNSYYQEKTDVR